MRDMTEKALNEAFAGESMAHMRYLLFSSIAEKEDLPNVARMFRAIAFAEQVHANNHAKNLDKINDTSQNLEACIDGENYEVEEMYPVFNQTAKMQGESGAQQSTHYALEAEKIHEKMYKEAKKQVDNGSDIELDDVYICPVCGYTHEGAPPDFCPVCSAKKETFKAF